VPLYPSPEHLHLKAAMRTIVVASQNFGFNQPLNHPARFGNQQVNHLSVVIERKIGNWVGYQLARARFVQIADADRKRSTEISTPPLASYLVQRVRASEDQTDARSMLYRATQEREKVFADCASGLLHFYFFKFVQPDDQAVSKHANRFFNAVQKLPEDNEWLRRVIAKLRRFQTSISHANSSLITSKAIRHCSYVGRHCMSAKTGVRLVRRWSKLISTEALLMCDCRPDEGF
jgi:hypothetical protein